MRGRLAEVRYAGRLLIRSPFSSFVAVVMLALGISFVSSFLSLYVHLVARSYSGVETGSRIVSIGATDGHDVGQINYDLIMRMGQEVVALDAIASATWRGALLVGPDNEMANPEYVTSGFFEGIRPMLSIGRGFESYDHGDDAEPVVVISDGFWRDRFDRSPDVIGQRLQLSGQPINGAADEETVSARIVGVMSQDVTGFARDGTTDLWLPWENLRGVIYGDESPVEKSTFPLSLGRVRPGATVQSLANEIEVRYSETYADYGIDSGYRIEVVKGIVRNVNVHREAKRQLWLFLACGALLAIASAINVSLFLLARLPARQREIDIRRVLGASTRRLVQQLAIESGLLVGISALLGMLTSIWFSSFMRGADFFQNVEWRGFSMFNWKHLVLVAAVLVILTIIVSMVPIAGLGSLSLTKKIRPVAGRPSRLQMIAGTSQVAVATGSIGMAAAFLWHIGSLTFGHPGYELSNRYVVYLARQDVIMFLSQPSDTETFRTIDTIKSLPGVTSVTVTGVVPAMSAEIGRTSIFDPTDSAREVQVSSVSIGSEFVEVLGLNLIRGRSLARDDFGMSLVNEAFARTFFGAEDVVGERVMLVRGEVTERQIVGVIEDVSLGHPAAQVEPMLLSNVTPATIDFIAIADYGGSANELRQEIQALIDSGELDYRRVAAVVSLQEVRSDLLARDRTRAMLTLAVATLVVVMALFGFYGMQRHLVSAGMREFAIRASLGAGPEALGRLVFTRGLIICLPGLAIGALLSYGLIAWLRDDYLSAAISPGLVTLVVIVIMTAMLQIACRGPALRVRRSNPALLLREN